MTAGPTVPLRHTVHDLLVAVGVSFGRLVTRSFSPAGKTDVVHVDPDPSACWPIRRYVARITTSGRNVRQCPELRAAAVCRRVGVRPPAPAAMPGTQARGESIHPLELMHELDPRALNATICADVVPAFLGRFVWDTGAAARQIRCHR